MNAPNAGRRLEDLERAVARLGDALAVPEDFPLAIDGSIQRFEFVFELCWKTMKALLERATPSEQFGTARAPVARIGILAEAAARLRRLSQCFFGGERPMA